ncbi:Ankyrin repeat domain-containing protein 50 [Colletotrichum fructicola]|nr:Ankyrin repeat domain-containing protein 50 [Colletotrichum fructicola]
MTTDQRPRRREDFRIAVLCALPLEYNAATLAFDEFFDEDGDKFGRARGDPNRYTTGRIGKYNVVMALLPGMGTVSSASAMASFRSSYTELKLALLVGICGGVPSPGTEKEVLLGDVIMSKTVVQYDFGRQNPHRFTTKDTLSDSLGRPNKDIRSLLASLETERTFERLERRTAEILTGIQQTAAQAGRKRTRYPYPGAAQDGLFSPTYEHRHRDDADCGCDDTWICDTAPDASCIELECDKTHLVLRESLEIKKRLEREGNTAAAQEPHILIGSVGSGNAVMRSGAHRDEIAQRYDLIAFEMEAAGAWDEVPCIVIKGVCDYADSHKNKKWQTFAAAAAASSMKALLELYIQTDSPGNSKIEFTTQRINEILTWISKEPYEQHHTLNKSEVLEGTGKWLLEDEVFQSWKNNKTSSILWLHGIPGSGKSKLTSIVVEDAMQSSPAATVYFYCSRNPAEPGRSNPTSIVASIARQLAMPQPGADILDAAVEAYRKFEDNAFASQALTLGESERLIHKLLDSYRGQTIIMIIDAIDESNRDTRQDLLDFLVSLLEASTIMKVFVSSRDDRDIVYKLDKYENLYLSSERNSEDIELFVRLETSRLVSKGSLLRGSSRKEELRDKIIFELISNAHGMFRWASLHIQELCHQATDAAIEERLAKMPRTAAVQNPGKAVEITSLLFNRYKSQIRITPDIAMAAFRNSAGIVKLLLDERGDEIDFSTDMILNAVKDGGRFSSSALILLMDMRNGQIHITEHFITTIASSTSCDRDLVERLLDEFGDEIQNTEAFFHAVIEKRGDKDIIMLLFDRLGTKLQNPARFMETIVNKFDKTTVRRFIDLHGGLIQINNTIVKAAVENECFAEDVVALLLDEYWDEVHITEDILEAVFENEYRGEWIMDLLLNERPHEIQITEELVMMAAQSQYGMMELILDRCGDNIDITDEIIDSCPFAHTIMAIIGRREEYKIKVTEKLLIQAAEQFNGITTQHGGLLQFLLDQRREDVCITEKIVSAAAGNGSYGVRLISLLIDRCGENIFITTKTLQAAASNTYSVENVYSADKVIEMILYCCGDSIRITEEIMSVAVQNRLCGSRVVESILEMYRDDVPVTNEIVWLAAGNEECGDKVVELLLGNCRGDTRITSETFQAAVRNSKCSHGIMAAIFDTPGVVDEKDEQLSVAIQEAPYDASRLGHGETVEVLLRSTADIDATGGYFGNALQVASFSGHRWVVQILLHNGADVNASAGFFGYALQAAAYCGYLNIIHLLIQNGADVNARGGAYETALEAASSEGHEATVQVLLERNADIHAQGGIENNALYAASLGGHTMIVQMLLQNNADVNTLGGKFGNALQAASFKGRQETVQMLLEYGADASCENGFYGGSMQAASAALAWTTAIVASVEQPCHTLLKAAITPFYSYCLPTPM